MKQRSAVILLVIMKLLDINAMMEGRLVDVDVESREATARRFVRQINTSDED